jgi:hypothetical protein
LDLPAVVKTDSHCLTGLSQHKIKQGLLGYAAILIWISHRRCGNPKGAGMAEGHPPNSGAPQPPDKPLYSLVEEVAAPWAEAINEVGQDIIRRKQEPPPQAKP